MRRAVINPDTNIVENVIEAGAGFRIKGCVLVTSATAGPGYSWDPETKTFAPRQPAPAYADADEARAAVKLLLDDYAVSLTGSVPISEQLAWPLKEAAARAYLSGTAGLMTAEQAALLRAEADITGETTLELARLIVRKADDYRAAVARIAGVRRRAEAAIAAVIHDYAAIVDQVRAALAPQN